MNELRTGGCLCGAVRFKAEGVMRGVLYCHCSQCRRQSGLYFAATQLPKEQLSVEGEDAITWFAASEEARRGFCSKCGSALFWKRDDEPDISVLAGAFDEPSGLVAERHIFVADKGDFYAIDDGLPQHVGGQGSRAPSES